MSSTAVERLAMVDANYRKAKDNEPSDLGRATNDAEVSAVRANLAEAQLAYYRAVAEALTKGGPAVETAFNKAKAARNAADESRAALEAFPLLLAKLQAATTTAGNLVAIAKA